MVFDLSNPDRPIHAGVILTKGVTEMVDVAPFEFFAWLDEESLKLMNFPSEMCTQAPDIRLHWVTEDGGIVRFKSGAQIKPTDSFETCPPLDIALMGANVPSYRLTEKEEAYIQKTYEDCSAFITICGGIFAMLEAGLLAGKTVSAPRMIVDLMKKQCPHVSWVDKRWSRDGKIWSSSTLLNGTDLIRNFATQTWPGRNGVMAALADAGHWPDRDVDFTDFKGSNYTVQGFEGMEGMTANA